MSKLIWIAARCMMTVLLGVLVLLVLGWGSAQAQVAAPPLAAALVRVCGGQPCTAVLPDAAQKPPQSKSRKRATRRST